VLLSPRQDAPPLHALAAKARALITLSGPEGGLSPAEQATALARGFVAARLGERVLRAETAPLAVLAWIGLSQAPGSPEMEPASSGARVAHRGGLADPGQP
jgi:16S rRNA (uracil1498-N3)-methyltransferase